MKSVQYYNQYDPAWSDYPYPSKNHPKATIQSSGCGVTCFAMVSSTFGERYTPIDGAKDAIAANDRGLEGTEDEYFGHMAIKYNIPFVETECLQVATEALQKGSLVVCRMKDWFRPGAGHFILAYAVDPNGKISINDPASRSNSQKLWDQSVFQKKCIRYFMFSKPATEKPMIYWDALQIIDKAIGIDEKYWDKRDNIDPYFDNLIIKFATYLKGA